MTLSALPYVDQEAWRLTRLLPPHIQLDDLVADGMLGAMQAACKYDPSIASFPTYVRHRIRGQMLDGLRERDVISRRDKWDPDDPILQTARPIDHKVTRGGQKWDFVEILADHAPPVEELALAEMNFQALIDMVPRQRDREILWWRFHDEVTLKEIATRIGVTESRVCQMIGTICGRLGKKIAAEDTGFTVRPYQRSPRRYFGH